ncbi:MAG: helix-turn-helix domain-containing protein [Brevundimonas sp.]|nr:MAG: helix-turn-helix domain-containing protein [Brevundimonas sp.]
MSLVDFDSTDPHDPGTDAWTGDALVPAGPGVIAVLDGVAACLTGSGLLARLISRGDRIVTSEGGPHPSPIIWLTDGRYVEDPGAPADAVALSEAGETIRGLQARLVCMASHRGVDRVADILLAIHARSGHTALALTQQGLAERTGLRRSTVNEACQALRAGGAIGFRRGNILIRDVAALEASACGCDAALRQPPKT